MTNPKTGKLSFSLPSTMESVSEIEAAADKLAAEAGIDEDERFRITMAVREAAVNAVLHGNDYDPAKQVTASFENNGKSLVFTIADQGKGVDWEHLPDPLAPENLLRGTGRGIFLIRSFMDEVHFRQLQPGTELTLIKHLTPAQETDLRRIHCIVHLSIAQEPIHMSSSSGPLHCLQCGIRCYNLYDSQRRNFRGTYYRFP